jgi:hypothetical protein
MLLIASRYMAQHDSIYVLFPGQFFAGSGQ